MRTMSLEWTGPAGPDALTLLAGPWRRCIATGDPVEVFRVHIPGDGAMSPASDARRVLASASTRLLAVLQPRGEPPRSAAELLQTLGGDGAELSTDIGPMLAELTRRGVGLARVESVLAGHPCVITEISTTGQLATRALPGATAQLLTLHREAVAAALHTRVTLLRAAITTTELAALIAAFASPAGPAMVGLALPLAWQFLRTLLREQLAPSPGE